MSRSPERAQFLADILCIFAEGGIQMIGYLVSAETHDDSEGIPEYSSVTVRYGDETEDRVVTLDTIAHAFTVMRGGADIEFLHGETRARYLAASRENEPADLDAIDATNIAEIGIFGKIVYG